LKIKDKAGLANVVADNLPCLGPEVNPNEELLIDELFSDVKLLAISHQATPMVCRFGELQSMWAVATRSISSTKEEVPFQC